MDARVDAARRALYKLEHDVRIMPFEQTSVRMRVLGHCERPKTLGEANRLIHALQAQLEANCSELPL